MQLVMNIKYQSTNYVLLIAVCPVLTVVSFTEIWITTMFNKARDVWWHCKPIFVKQFIMGHERVNVQTIDDKQWNHGNS